jgi:hypothetical protein
MPGGRSRSHLSFIIDFVSAYARGEHRWDGIVWLEHPTVPIRFPSVIIGMDPPERDRRLVRAVNGMGELQKVLVPAHKRLMQTLGESVVGRYMAILQEYLYDVARALEDVLNLEPGMPVGHAETQLMWLFADAAQGSPEEDSRLVVLTMLLMFYVNDPWVLFFAQWRLNGQPKLRLDGKLAASLMFTDYPPGLMKSLEPPWSGFVLEIPDGLLSSFTRMFIGRTDDDRGKGWIISLRERGGSIEMTGDDLDRVYEADLELDQPGPAKHDLDELRKIPILATRLLMGVVSLLNEPKSNLSQPTIRKKGRPKWLKPAASEVGQYVLGRDIHINIDCREAVHEYLTRPGQSLRKIRWPVRGHKRWQAHGPKHAERKLIWIQPHWRGEPNAPLLVRTHVLHSTAEATAEKPSAK